MWDKPVSWYPFLASKWCLNSWMSVFTTNTCFIQLRSNYSNVPVMHFQSDSFKLAMMQSCLGWNWPQIWFLMVSSWSLNSVLTEKILYTNRALDRSLKPSPQLSTGFISQPLSGSQPIHSTVSRLLSCAFLNPINFLLIGPRFHSFLPVWLLTGVHLRHRITHYSTQ